MMDDRNVDGNFDINIDRKFDGNYDVNFYGEFLLQL